MKTREIMLICHYAKEEISIAQIIQTSFVGDHALEIWTVEAGPAPTVIDVGIVDAEAVLLDKLVEQGLLVVYRRQTSLRLQDAPNGEEQDHHRRERGPHGAAYLRHGVGGGELPSD